MKKLLITSIFYLFLYVNIFAQCNPNAGVDNVVCGLTYTFFNATLGDINSTGTWSTNATGVVFSDINDPNANVTVSSYQSIEFYWTEDNTIIPCTDEDTAIITFIEIPVANAGIDDQVCGLSANLTGSFSSGNTGFWTSSPAGAIFTPVNSPTATVTVPGYGIYIFTWEEDNNLCTSTDDVVVEFLQTLPTANAGIDQTVCGLFVNLDATISFLGNTGYWSGPANFSDIYDPDATANITNIPGTQITHTLYWYETNGVCGGTTDSVEITFVNTPSNFNAGYGGATCNSSFTLLANTIGVSYVSSLWTSNVAGVNIHNPNDTATVVDIISLVPSVYDTSNCRAPIYFYLTLTNGAGCSVTDSVLIGFFQNPIANAGMNDSICGLYYDFNAIPSLNCSYGTWSVIDKPTAAGPEDYVDFTDPQTGVNVPMYGYWTFQWEEANDNNFTCFSRDTVTIHFLETPNIDAGPRDTVCGHFVELNATSAGFPGQWLHLSGAVWCTSNDLSTIDTLQRFQPNTWVYHNTLNDSAAFIWQECNAMCCNIDTVWILFDESYPAVHNVAAHDTVQCGLTTEFLNAATPQPGLTGYWYDEVPLTQFHPDVNVTDAIAEATYYGQHYFHWVVVGAFETCRDTTAAIPIRFVEMPIADAGPAYDTACGYSYVLEPIPSIGVGMWSSPNLGGHGWFNSTDSLNSFMFNDTVTVDLLNTDIASTFDYYEFVWTEANWGCVSSDTIRVRFEEYARVFGNVLYNLNPLNPGDAEIELFNINSGNYELNDISSIAGNNIFNLQGNKSGDYILKANVLNHISYPDAMNTYYDDAFLWENVQIFTLTCGDSINIDINLARTIAFTPGSGKVSGVITYEGSGNPVTDAVFFIEDTTVNDPYLYTDVNINGYYQFVGLPQGNFRILVDLPGIPQITTHNFSVTATNNLFEDYDFYVDTILYRETGIGIYADTAAIESIDNPQLNVSLISLYPNPFENNINLEYKLEQNSIVEIQIIDISGKIIHVNSAKSLNSGNYSETIAIADKGIYFVVVSINKDTYIKKVVSQ